MKIYLLNKTVLRLTNDVENFLQGLAANTIDKPHNAFLNLHGRIIATFDQIKISAEEVWIVVGEKFIENVLAHLDRYAKLSGVKIEKLGLNVYFDCDGDSPLSSGDRIIPQKKGRLVITVKPLKADLSEKEFTLFRLKNNIPLHGVDYQDELILNVSETDFVSFTKGCFLGQEPVAKVHNRSKPTWKLVVKHEDECDAEEKEKMTSKQIDPVSNRILGFVFAKNINDGTTYGTK